MKMIRSYQIVTALSGIIGLLSACEDEIYPELPKARPAVVVDAWINDLPRKQVVKITKTLPYYEAVEPPGVTGAEVTITDDLNNVYPFVEQGEGQYIWTPDSVNPAFGAVERKYVLNIQLASRTLTATSSMKRVPGIDSITWRFEKGNDFFPDAYFGSLYARDPKGRGDTYWIKTYKNGIFLNKPNEITVAWDAAFSPGSNVDGVTFIQPIRDAVNPFDQDENGRFLSPYAPGDSVYVEIHSITNEAFTFLREAAVQMDRPGGFGELFATPLSNVPTNIVNVTPGSNEPVLGFFNVSAVSGKGKLLDPGNLPTGE